MKRTDETNNTYGRLTVNGYSHSDKRGLAFWTCTCECGNVTVVSGDKLRSGWTKSCGCLTAETSIKNLKAVVPGYRTEAGKNSFSEKMKGKRRPPFSEEWKRHIKEGYTKPEYTEEFRKRKSEYCKGEKCHLWKGGVTPVNAKIRKSVDYKIWREKVFSRDNFTCQYCGKRGGNLEAHHILPFSLFEGLRFEVSNGATLCVDCHNTTKKHIR